MYGILRFLRRQEITCVDENSQKADGLRFYSPSGRGTTENRWFPRSMRRGGVLAGADCYKSDTRTLY